MADSIDKSPLESIAEVLLRHGVRFIVIGGQAELLHGSARVTYDVDLCYERSRDNLERLAEALREIGVSLRDAPPDLPFLLDAHTLAMGTNFTFDSKFEALDLLGWVEPLGGYEEIGRNAEIYPVGGIELKVISLEDLIRIKEHIQRPKDRDSLFHLRAIKQVREEMKQEKDERGTNDAS
jgi:predicted nucleotidyltransferase